MQVTVVGLIRKVETSSTNILYVLDDMTGPTIEIRHWIDNDVSTEYTDVD